MARWHFRQHDGFDDIVQSSSAEAFEGSALKGLASSVVRESLQNALDVHLDKSRPVRVRFTLGVRQSFNETASIWFEHLMHHLQQPDAGAPEAPTPAHRCPYLLIEDFNTCGLVGDYTAPYVPGTENNFVNFLYHDGLTGKSAQKLGSRGVGKIVLLLASRARTMFAYTIRDGELPVQPLLVGKSLLKFRRVDDRLYEPAGYFLDCWPEGQARRPVIDPALLHQFQSDFGLARTDERGLSVVIPYLDPSITLADLRRAVVEEYHYAILGGQLVVELSENGRIERIDADHIPDVGDQELSARVALSGFAITHPVPDLQTLAPPAGEKQELSAELVSDPVREKVLDGLGQQERIAVRCHLHIHPKDAPPVLTHCDVYFEHVENLYQRPVFVRELLPISGEGKPCPQIRALVLIRPGPLADLLRAAEGANHTQWSPRTDNFKKAYKGRLGEIEFVGNCVNRLIEIVRGNATEPVGGISTFFFSAPLDDANKKRGNKGKKQPGTQPQKPDPPETETEPVGYRFSKEADGFTISGDPDMPLPGRISVRVAYDVIRGSAWSDYDPDDFDLRKTRGDVRVIGSGAEIERLDPGNRLTIKPFATDFEVVVSGFNPHLDLIVDHRGPRQKPRGRKENPDASETAELYQPQ